MIGRYWLISSSERPRPKPTSTPRPSWHLGRVQACSAIWDQGSTVPCSTTGRGPLLPGPKPRQLGHPERQGPRVGVVSRPPRGQLRPLRFSPRAKCPIARRGASRARRTPRQLDDPQRQGPELAWFCARTPSLAERRQFGGKDNQPGISGLGAGRRSVVQRGRRGADQGLTGGLAGMWRGLLTGEVWRVGGSACMDLFGAERDFRTSRRGWSGRRSARGGRLEVELSERSGMHGRVVHGRVQVIWPPGFMVGNLAKAGRFPDGAFHWSTARLATGHLRVLMPGHVWCQGINIAALLGRCEHPRMRGRAYLLLALLVVACGKPRKDEPIQRAPAPSTSAMTSAAPAALSASTTASAPLMTDQENW